jgi:DNA polymerase-3 subunit epsilon
MFTRMRLNRRRSALARRTEAAVVRDYLAVDLPAASRHWRDIAFVALDMETTGLDVASAEMLSIGWVPVIGGRVHLGAAKTFIVCPEGGVGQSATVHGLTDTAVRAGLPAERVLESLLADLAGKILIVHHAPLDIGILERLAKLHFGAPVPFGVIDTLALERSRLSRHDTPTAKDGLRLMNLRTRYHLPDYRSHNCLTDAIATAELFLAMVLTRYPADDATLGDLWG